MAWIPLGRPKNTNGDSGNFETDPFTWGMPLISAGEFALERLYGTSYLGNHCCKAVVSGTAFSSGKYNTGVNAIANLEAGSHYYVSAYVRVPAVPDFPDEPPASTTAILQIKSNNGLNEIVSERVTKTISQATGAWVQIVAVFENDQAAGNKGFNIEIVDSGADTINQFGETYVDKFWVQSAEDDTEACTIAVDLTNTIITAETTPGANDGSITVAVSGGTAPFEYSKDSGSTWQASNQFTGLAPGIYTIGVREQNNTSCAAYATRYINAASPDFDFTMAITDETVSGANNGQISITVTGSGTAPFTYSKDGGVTYQGSNLFTGLAPGDYIITVKDDNDLVVAKNATIDPGEVIFEKIYFSKNYIPFSLPLLGNGSEENYRNYVDVRVQDVLNGPYNSKLKTAIELNSEGLSKFNLRPAFRGVFSFTPPSSQENTIKRLTDRIKLYKNYYKYTEDDQIEPELSLTETNPFLVVFGGLDKKKYPDIDYFYEYLPDNQKAMSWQPIHKYVDAAQEEYLQFWVYDLNFTSLKLMVKAYYDDETNETSNTKTLSLPVYGAIYQLPAGPVNSGASAINPAKNMIKYELWLTDQDDNTIMELRTYEIIKYKHPNTRYFLFLTSLGAFEVVRTIGQTENIVEFSGDIIERFLGEDYSATDGQYRSGNKVKQNTARHSTGFITGKYAKEWLEYMQDFLLSPLVYEITTGDRVPVIIDTKQMRKSKDRDNMRYVRFEVKEAYQEDIYTPEVI